MLGMFGFLEPRAWQSVPSGSEGRSGILRSIADIRDEFSNEPQIHGYNQQALRLLEARRRA